MWRLSELLREWSDAVVAADTSRLTSRCWSMLVGDESHGEFRILLTALVRCRLSRKRIHRRQPPANSPNILVFPPAVTAHPCCLSLWSRLGGLSDLARAEKRGSVDVAQEGVSLRSEAGKGIQETLIILLFGSIGLNGSDGSTTPVGFGRVGLEIDDAANRFPCFVAEACSSSACFCGSARCGSLIWVCIVGAILLYPGFRRRRSV